MCIYIQYTIYIYILCVYMHNIYTNIYIYMIYIYKYIYMYVYVSVLTEALLVINKRS